MYFFHSDQRHQLPLYCAGIYFLYNGINGKSFLIHFSASTPNSTAPFVRNYRAKLTSITSSSASNVGSSQIGLPEIIELCWIIAKEVKHEKTDDN